MPRNVIPDRQVRLFWYWVNYVDLWMTEGGELVNFQGNSNGRGQWDFFVASFSFRGFRKTSICFEALRAVQHAFPCSAKVKIMTESGFTSSPQTSFRKIGFDFINLHRVVVLAGESSTMRMLQFRSDADGIGRNPNQFMAGSSASWIGTNE